MKKILLVYSLITGLTITKQPAPIKQGINGKTYLKQGNYMPSTGMKTSNGKPIQATVFVYQLTNREQATDDNGHFTNIQTKLVAKGQSNTNGFYTIKLAAGHYSVFVDDNGQLYANTFDGKGHICPVEVKKDSVSSLNLVINSRAVY